MKNDYIVDGEVAREKISMDIKRRKLDRAGIERLCLDPDIQAAFFGAGYNDRRPQGEWNKDYEQRHLLQCVIARFERICRTSQRTSFFYGEELQIDQLLPLFVFVSYL